MALLLPESFLQHIILCDAVVSQRFIPLRVQCLVDCLCAQFGGLKHSNTQRVMHNTHWDSTATLWATWDSAATLWAM